MLIKKTAGHSIEAKTFLNPVMVSETSVLFCQFYPHVLCVTFHFQSLSVFSPFILFISVLLVIPPVSTGLSIEARPWNASQLHMLDHVRLHPLAITHILTYAPYWRKSSHKLCHGGSYGNFLWYYKNNLANCVWRTFQARNKPCSC